MMKDLGPVSQNKPSPPVLPLDKVNFIFLTSTPLIALIGVPLYLNYRSFSLGALAMFAFYMAATGLSITAGYHRLYSHRAYTTHRFVRLFFLIFGAAACQNAILKWASDHRRHHNYVDTGKDPYNIKFGFFYAHMGWIFYKTPQNELSRDNAKDLLADPDVMWQHRNYIPLAIGVGGVLPFLIGFLFHDAMGGLLLAGIARIVIVHHATFLINSLCHFMGRQTYSLNNSARDSAFVALITYGEGFHNFHHRFASDYRNGIRWFDFDPSKWLIKTLATLGLAENLRITPDAQIFKARLEVEKEEAHINLKKFSKEFRESIEKKVQTAHEKLLASYERFLVIKGEYRSFRESVDAKGNEMVLKLKGDLQKAKAHFKDAHASWVLLVQECCEVPA